MNDVPMVVHVTTGLGVGGAERMLLRLCETTRDRLRHGIVSLTNEAALESAFEWLDIPVVKLGLPASISVRSFAEAAGMLPRLYKAVTQFQPDVIQGWMYHGNLAASFAGILTQRPTMWNVRHSIHDISHESRATALLIRLGAKLSRGPYAVIFNSAVSAQQHQTLGYCAERAVVVPNGFDTRQFRPSSEARVSLRDRLAVAQDTFLVGITGRFDPAKDHECFLRAARMVEDVSPHVHFVLTGRGLVSGHAPIELLIRKTGAQNVHLLGEVQDVVPIVAGLDVAVCSSVTEGFPNAIGEAMACGIACVTTDVGDAAYLVGKTGLVVPASDPHALATAISKMIALPPERRLELGGRARDRVAELFDIEAVSAQYVSLYRSASDPTSGSTLSDSGLGNSRSTRVSHA